MNKYIGRYVKILSLPEDNYGYPVEEGRKTALGRVCRVIPYHYENDYYSLDPGGILLVDCAIISPDGVDHVNFYVREHDIEIVKTTEEMVLLYSDDLWELLKPFGEYQDTDTFKKLVNYFGYS